MGRRRSFRSIHNKDCFTGEELDAYLRGSADKGKTARIREHLLDCRYCRDAYRLAASASDDGSQELPAARRLDTREAAALAKRARAGRERVAVSGDQQRIELGQIRTTRAAADDPAGGKWNGDVRVARPVVVIDPGDGSRAVINVVRVAPISYDIEFAVSGEDLVAREGEGPLGCAFVIALWNEQPALAANLGRFLGRLGSDLMRRLDRLRSDYLAGRDREEDSGAQGGATEETADHDLQRFRRRELEETRYLREPAEAWLLAGTAHGGLWAASGRDDRPVEVEVPAMDLPLAADAGEIVLEREGEHLCLRDDALECWVLRVDDEFHFAVYCDDPAEIDRMLVDGGERRIVREGRSARARIGEHWTIKGQVRRVTFTHRGESREFVLRFLP